MKIAVWHNLPSGGGKRALYAHVKGLVARGHTVISWCPPTADQTYLPLSQLAPERVMPLSWAPIDRGNSRGGFSRLLVDYHNNNTHIKVKAMNQHCRQCAQEINQAGFDILLAHACTFFRVTAIGRYTTIPKVLYLQEPYRWLYEAMPTFPWAALPSPGNKWWTPGYIKKFLMDELKVRWLRVQAREEFFNAQAYDAILVNSFYSRESVLRAYGLDARVCYLGIDTSLFVDQGVQQRENFIIGVGAFVPEKNIKLVIEALACLKARRPSLRWAGNVVKTEYLDELQRYADAVQVDFIPMVRVSDRQLVDLYNQAMMMVYAPRLEPFGLAPLEANACGTPVIAVAEGGVRETVLDGVNGILVEHSPQAIAGGIQRLVADKAFARQLGQNGVAFVNQRWSMDAAIDRLESRLVQVLTGAQVCS
ncbi:MAG: glycosyltransferase family 4 protein [Anaerolineales bacterium]|nr:glycosyltransferase family 4 protein [Anaerolineales bacterium]